ncbi:DUF4089 domain-containing protein [Kovacikia minuta CCNUW1]|uniref:DUF4089 domain-containing protein n=1 Tax=Kovacikia minuta TaxID=2931930 RepID=UPI001CCBFD8B|nr:DUF4089 domain-containing protein [Kovacikia minuta]UBF25632.1 DUF4089 domain-containing protein [Kovacikia minuta CCNUW1]
MTQQPIDPTAYIDQAVAVLGLPLQPEHKPGVVENFVRIMAIAQLVNEFPLPEETEAGPIFEP